MRICPAVLFAGLSLVPLATLHADDAKPNVILLLTDDQGYGDLSCHGNPVLKTPHLDRLYNESVRFTNFHVDSYCTPTRAALMTGRYAHRVGGWGTVCGRNMLRDDELTMADVFQHNGYRTGLFGKWHLGTNYPYRPIDRGFDVWLGHGDGGTGCTTDYWGNDRVNDHYIDNGPWEDNPREGYECDVFFDAATEFIRDNKHRPFFAYVALYNPHGPCSIPDTQWTKSYREQKIPADFYATIVRLDENIGRLRDFLEDEGLADNTLLIYLTDNGTAAGEQVFNAGMRGKKGSPYDGGHRVPCFLHWRGGGFDKPVTVDRLTAHVDLLPTLIDLCSLKLPRPIRFDGVSLQPLLSDPRVDWHDRTLVLGTPQNQVAANPPPPRHGVNCAVMTDRWRLVNNRELYDIAADPGQRQELSDEQPQVVDALRAVYDNYWESVSQHDQGWRGRPIIGAGPVAEVTLCAEDWYPTKGNCPWNQAAVARGIGAFGYWPVRIAEAGVYQIEVRRWPSETKAPLAGIPKSGKTVDAYLRDQPVTGLLYGGEPNALPVARVRLRLGMNSQEMAVDHSEVAATFTAAAAAGPTDIEATLLDPDGRPLCSAFYVAIRKLPQGK